MNMKVMGARGECGPRRSGMARLWLQLVVECIAKGWQTSWSKCGYCRLSKMLRINTADQCTTVDKCRELASDSLNISERACVDRPSRGRFVARRVLNTSHTWKGVVYLYTSRARCGRGGENDVLISFQIIKIISYNHKNVSDTAVMPHKFSIHHVEWKLWAYVLAPCVIVILGNCLASIISFYIRHWMREKWRWVELPIYSKL